MARMVFPEVAISRDGNRGVLVTEVSEEPHRMAERGAVAMEARVRLRPRVRPCEIQMVISDALATFWDSPNQTLRWQESFKEVLPELAVSAIGEYLDGEPIPPQPGDFDYAAVVNLSTEFFNLFEREPEQSDAKLLRFIGGKIFWAYRLGADMVTLERYDGLRFGVTEADLHHVAVQGEGVFWERVAKRTYRPLPTLLNEFWTGALPGHERPPLEQVQDAVDPVRYPAAKKHLAKAMAFLTGESPDLENAAKEAVTAAESVAVTILKGKPATLGACIKEFKRRGVLTREVGQMIQSLYDFRSATPGVGHGSDVVPFVPERDARLVLDVAAAVIRYLGTIADELSATVSSSGTPTSVKKDNAQAIDP